MGLVRWSAIWLRRLHSWCYSFRNIWFSCNKDWEVEQDSDYDTIEDAIKSSPNQYKNILIKWKEYK